MGAFDVNMINGRRKKKRHARRGREFRKRAAAIKHGGLGAIRGGALQRAGADGRDALDNSAVDRLVEKSNVKIIHTPVMMLDR